MFVFKSRFLILGSWFALVAACLCSARARADTVFDLTGAFVDNSTVSGTLTINTTTGVIDAASLLYTDNTYSVSFQGPFTGGTASGQTPVPVGVEVDFESGAPTAPIIVLFIRGTSSVDSLIAYAGGSLCSVDAPCGPDQEGRDWASQLPDVPLFLQTGELTATPLPAALPLFATSLGALGLLGWRRKRRHL
jgi:hypothetical protein